MAIRPFLAMTAAEIRGTEALPPKTAWMACHFSPYSTGLSNLPKALPPGSMVILDDITPIHGHDSETIAAQLRPRLDALKCSGVLLDFQRPGYEEAELLAGRLSEALPLPPWGVSALYGRGADLSGLSAARAAGCKSCRLSRPMAGKGNLAGAGVGRRDHYPDTRRRYHSSPAPGDAAFRRTPGRKAALPLSNPHGRGQRALHPVPHSGGFR